MKALINERIDARARKDFQKSDELRDKLKSLGVLIEDTKDGYKVKYI
jgi:cysteinyl-tRNA synthetase